TPAAAAGKIHFNQRLAAREPGAPELPMHDAGNRKVIYAALAGNLAITLLKFIAATLTGSAAMMAEGFHSAADSGNQLMLLIGHHRAAKPPDEEHPYGYGQEIYFWAFMVSVTIFFVGALFSLFEGVEKLLHPHPISSIRLSLTVIAVAVLLEGYPWLVAVNEVRRHRKYPGLRGFIKQILEAKDPTIMVVFFEDSAALAGLAIAALGVSLAWHYQQPAFDALASLAIGAILLYISFILARETRNLLIGESASREHRQLIRRVVTAIPQVRRCGRIMTMHLGPANILLNLDIEFVDGLSTDEVEAAVDAIENKIRAALPLVKKIYIEAESLTGREAASSRTAP
ncbi:MAG: cation transporter, partial [Deltaproteobacteria bacterium]|nr:cation transporter [Deltaproteobacteria bacterium]